MYCTKCGAQIQEDSAFCKICGAKVEEDYERSGSFSQGYEDNTQEKSGCNIKYVPEIKNYFVQNLLLTIFSAIMFLWLALPTSVAGLVFSCIAKGAASRNDADEAQKYSKLAKIFMWISFGLAIACIVVIIIAIAIGLTAAIIGAGLYY